MKRVTIASVLLLLILISATASGGDKIGAAKGRGLHSSLSGSYVPVLQWRTANYIVRVDDMGYSRFRYAAWDADADQSDEPNIILNNGVYVPDGTGGNGFYRFYNEEYTYECYVCWIGTGETPGYLRVYQNDDRILNERVLEVIYSNR